MIMVTYPPALRRTGFVAPRAVGRMGAAVVEARAADRTPAAPPPAAPAPGRVVPMPVRPRERTVIRLWLPLTLVFLLLAPFALLFSPLLWLAPEPYRLNPFRTVFALGAVLLSLSGTVVDVDAREARVLIRIY